MDDEVKYAIVFGTIGTFLAVIMILQGCWIFKSQVTDLDMQTLHHIVGDTLGQAVTRDQERLSALNANVQRLDTPRPDVDAEGHCHLDVNEHLDTGLVNYADFEVDIQADTIGDDQPEGPNGNQSESNFDDNVKLYLNSVVQPNVRRNAHNKVDVTTVNVNQASDQDSGCLDDQDVEPRTS